MDPNHDGQRRDGILDLWSVDIEVEAVFRAGNLQGEWITLMGHTALFRTVPFWLIETFQRLRTLD